MTSTRKRTSRGGRLSEQLVTELESMIVEEYPEAGARLPPEDALAERFHVSRIVVREAMKIVEERGLVEVRAGRGTLTVARSWHKVREALTRAFKNQPFPTLPEMESMLELRQMLEETAAEMAAVRATPKDLHDIGEALAAMERGGSEQETVEADLHFHQAVAQASHNRYLEIVLDSLTDAFLQQIRLTNSYSVGAELHRRLFEAIEKANPIAARQTARRLLRDTLNHIRVALQSVSSPVPEGSGSRS